jgi:inhibitor of cysteine peptidase
VLAAVVAIAAVLATDYSLAQGEIALSHSDAGREISLTEDQVLEIALDANPSTGFQWEVVALDTAILVESDLDAPAYGAAEVPGAAVQQRLRFRPVAAGRTVLNLAYRRPWQGDVAPAATFSVTVVGSGHFTGANIPTPTATPDPNVTPTLPAVPTSDVGGLALPTSFNWCDQGDCTPIKDQAQCGSCWAFATAGVFELAIKIKDGLTKDLSEQYLVSCNTEGYSCDGGLWVHEYHENYAPPGEPAAGAVYESDFPYVAADVACNAPHVHRERISSWANVPGGGYGQVPTTAAMKQAIHDRGPRQRVHKLHGRRVSLRRSKRLPERHQPWGDTGGLG